VDIIEELKEYNIQAEVYDPWVSTEEAQREYGITPVAKLDLSLVFDSSTSRCGGV